MSLALRMYFWTDSDWVAAAPAPAPSVQSPTDAGGGGAKRRRKLTKPPYIPTPPDFWDVREEYLRSLTKELKPELPEPIPLADLKPEDIPSQLPNPDFLPAYVTQRTEAISALQLATSAAQLKQAALRLIEANRSIAIARRLELARAAEQEAVRRRIEARRSLRSQKRQAAITAAKLMLTALKRVSGPHN